MYKISKFQFEESKNKPIFACKRPAGDSDLEK
jgi:hypothetical protein